MSVEERMRKLERGFQHLDQVMTTQRENICRAFEQVQMALLEQQVTLRSQMLEVFSVLGELGEETAELRSRVENLEKRPPAA